MYRITTIYAPETSTFTINVFIIIAGVSHIIGTKKLFADINYDESVTFGTSRLTYKSFEFSNFINDIKNNLGTQFYFDQSNDEDGSVDGILYGNNTFLFSTIFGKNCLTIQMPVTDENKDLLIEDLQSMHTEINKYAVDAINEYRALGDNIESDDEKDKTEQNEEK